MSHDRVRRLLPVMDRFWVKECGVADRHLLDERLVSQLFPDARITVERLLGMRKSVIASTSR
jgi:hypothetical protein